MRDQDRNRIIERELPPILGKLSKRALRLTGNRHDADDLLQETIEHALAGLPTYRSGFRFANWMNRIMANIHVNRWRRRKALGRYLQSAAHAPRRRTGMREAEILHQVDDQIGAAITALPQKLRRVVLLYSVGDRTLNETAKELNIPLGTALSRMHRARAFLREALKRMEGGRGCA